MRLFILWSLPLIVISLEIRRPIRNLSRLLALLLPRDRKLNSLSIFFNNIWKNFFDQNSLNFLVVTIVKIIFPLLLDPSLEPRFLLCLHVSFNLTKFVPGKNVFRWDYRHSFVHGTWSQWFGFILNGVFCKGNLSERQFFTFWLVVHIINGSGGRHLLMYTGFTWLIFWSFAFVLLFLDKWLSLRFINSSNFSYGCLWWSYLWALLLFFAATFKKRGQWIHINNTVWSIAPTRNIVRITGFSPDICLEGSNSWRQFIKRLCDCEFVTCNLFLFIGWSSFRSDLEGPWSEGLRYLAIVNICGKFQNIPGRYASMNVLT